MTRPALLLLLVGGCAPSCETVPAPPEPRPVCLRGHRETREDLVMSEIMRMPMTEDVFVCDAWAPERAP